MGEEIRERIEQLRNKMAERGLDAYLIPTADFHGSEYVCEHFKCRQYMTGFTGSAGTAVITMEEAGLWTDGRYFVQAAAELKGSGIRLFKAGTPGTPGVIEYLIEKVPESGALGADGRVLDAGTGERLRKKLEEKNARFFWQEDLAGELWQERPELPAEPVWILEQAYAGRTMQEKTEAVRAVMKQNRAGVHILTTLDDIGWLLNLRGSDVPCTPVVLSYVIVTEKEVLFFVNQETLGREVRRYLEDGGVRIFPYEEVYSAAGAFRHERVMVERAKINYRLLCSLDDSVTIVDRKNPTVLMKAVKNPVEQENLRKAHLKDGLAVTRFMRWIKEQVKEGILDESGAAAWLDRQRRMCPGNLGLSFDTISAYGSNAAMCHYSAPEKNSRRLEPKGLYLVDSGGQYYEGTTDVTRTMALGPLTEEEKKCCTLVAASMLRLLNVKFLYGCRGINLDFAARELLWRNGMDFNHGTGHGVGFVNCVHEGPEAIRWRMAPDPEDNAVLEAGMVISDEPGLYLEGKFGVRTENLMLCVPAEENEFGRFMKFENLTWVPIDLDTIDASILEERDRELLNAYHREVYARLSPFLEKEERDWLKEATRPV